MIGHSELLWLVVACIVLLVCGLAVSSWVGERFGLVGRIVGFVVGVVGTALLVSGALIAFVRLGYAGPSLPPCHNGTCRAGVWPALPDEGDFELIIVGDMDVYRCKCGREYVLTYGDHRCAERLPDGALKPYMVHWSFRGWFPDGDGDR